MTSFLLLEFVCSIYLRLLKIVHYIWFVLLYALVESAIAVTIRLHFRIFKLLISVDDFCVGTAILLKIFVTLNCFFSFVPYLS